MMMQVEPSTDLNPTPAVQQPPAVAVCSEHRVLIEQDNNSNKLITESESSSSTTESIITHNGSAEFDKLELAALDAAVNDLTADVVGLDEGEAEGEGKIEESSQLDHNDDGIMYMRVDEGEVEEEDTPISYLSLSGKRVYSRSQLIGLFPHDKQTPHLIPVTLRDFYTPSDYERGSVDGTKYARLPMVLSGKGDYSSSSAIGGKGDGRGGGGGDNRGGGRSHHGSSRGGGSDRGTINYSSNRSNQHGNNNSGHRLRYEREGNESPAIDGGGGGSTYDNDQSAASTPVYKPLFQVNVDDPEVTVRKANFILNKLSVTKYDKLSDEFLALLQEECVSASKDGSEKLRRTVDALLSKAQMEESFCFMYADLCSKIITSWLTDVPIEMPSDTANNTTSTIADANVEPTEEKVTELPLQQDTDKEKSKEKEEVKVMGKVFRLVLLSRCQAEFEFDHAQAIADIRNNNQLEAGEREEKEILAKKRITGT